MEERLTSLVQILGSFCVLAAQYAVYIFLATAYDSAPIFFFSSGVLSFIAAAIEGCIREDDLRIDAFANHVAAAAIEIRSEGWIIPKLEFAVRRAELDVHPLDDFVAHIGRNVFCGRRDDQFHQVSVLFGQAIAKRHCLADVRIRTDQNLCLVA